MFKYKVTIYTSNTQSIKTFQIIHIILSIQITQQTWTTYQYNIRFYKRKSDLRGKNQLQE